MYMIPPVSTTVTPVLSAGQTKVYGSILSSLAMKTLTDVTPYTDFVKKTQSLFDGESTNVAIQDEDEEERTYDPYTADDFLHDVFMDEDRYNILKALLLTKKNVILQGAPGVGKTFAAKRLAYSIMGEKDTNRVKMVQFPSEL